MFDDLALWFNENVQVILTTLGFTGAGTGALTGVWLFIKGLGTDIKNVFTNENSALRKEVNELKEQNKVLMDYVRESSLAKAESSVLSTEQKAKFQEIGTKASTFYDKVQEVVEDIKGKF